MKTTELWNRKRCQCEEVRRVGCWMWPLVSAWFIPRKPSSLPPGVRLMPIGWSGGRVFVFPSAFDFPHTLSTFFLSFISVSSFLPIRDHIHIVLLSNDQSQLGKQKNKYNYPLFKAEPFEWSIQHNQQGLKPSTKIHAPWWVGNLRLGILSEWTFDLLVFGLWPNPVLTVDAPHESLHWLTGKEKLDDRGIWQLDFKPWAAWRKFNSSMPLLDKMMYLV